MAITDSQQRSLQKHCDAELVKAYQAFAELLEHQDIEVHKRLDTYDKRADALEERFATEKARILQEIEAESQRLSKLLDEFQEAFEEEVRVRKAREEVILRQMDQHERHITQNFDVEYEARVKRVKEIQEELVACMKSRVAADVELDRVCQEEVDKIQTLIDAEVSQRERQDDNIMRALDQYTDKMQASLEIVNSTNAKNGPSCVFERWRRWRYGASGWAAPLSASVRVAIQMSARQAAKYARARRRAGYSYARQP